MHITFDPSVIQPPRHINPSISQTAAGLTARELLRPNFFLYKPKINSLTSNKSRSPYEINDNKLFSMRASSNTTSKHSLFDEKEEKRNLSEKVEEITIENFNPQVPTVFTEKATILAIQNLGIQQSDLFFPTNSILEKINGDKLYFKNLLIERALKYREDVRNERLRLLNSNESEFINTEVYENEPFIENDLYNHDNNINWKNNRIDKDVENQSNNNKNENHKANYHIDIHSSNNYLHHTPDSNHHNNLGSDISNAFSSRDSRESKRSNFLRSMSALERSRMIAERKIEEKKRLVAEIEIRHEKILKELQNERELEIQTQRETNEEKRKRSMMFNMRQKEEHIRKIEESEKLKREAPKFAPILRKRNIQSSLEHKFSRKSTEIVVKPQEKSSTFFEEAKFNSD